LATESLVLYHSARFAILGFLETIVVDLMERIASKRPYESFVTVECLIEAVEAMEWTQCLPRSSPLSFASWLSWEAWNDPTSRLVLSMLRHDPKQCPHAARTLSFFEPWNSMRHALFDKYRAHRSTLPLIDRPAVLHAKATRSRASGDTSDGFE
jgi:hypothetical protein